MEKMINKRRAGDENIGKLIVFAITIVIAIGLVGLVSYFYTQSREAAVNTGVLGSTSSTNADIIKVKGLGSCTASGVTYDAISNVYSFDNGAVAANAGPCNVTGLKGVTVSGSGYTLSK
jgi:hypothetical protein